MLTTGQRKFLWAVRDGGSEIFHVSVTGPLFRDLHVFPRPGALFPWVHGCNGQQASDYYLTENGLALIEQDARDRAAQRSAMRKAA